MRFRTPPGAAAVAAALLGLGATLARAQEQMQEQAQERDGSAAEAPSDLADAAEIIVTATRRPASGFDVPALTSRVGRGGGTGMETRLRRTVTDALVDLPSVMVQKTAYGQASPYIRGFTGYRTVMLVDGVRLNNSTFRSGPNQYWATIDPFTVDRIEVVRGPGSVLYGSDAVGGVVNAVARRGGLRAGAGGGGAAAAADDYTGARTFTRWSDAEGSWTVRGETEGRRGDLSFLAGGTYRSYGDLVAGRGTREQPGTGYRDTDGDVRLDWRQNDDVVWSLGVQHVDQDNVPRTHKTVDAVPFRGSDVGTELKRDLDQTRDLVYLRWAASGAWSFADRIEATGSWQRQKEKQHRIRDTSREDVQGVDVQTLGLQVQMEKGTDDYGDLTYGVEWWHDDVDSFRRDFKDGVLDLDRVQGPVADDANYDLVGVFVQDELRWDRTTVTAGVRYTYAKAIARDVDNPAVSGGDPATPGNVIRVTDDWSDLVGSVRVMHPLSEQWHAFGGVSQAFRAPNLSDLTRLDDTSGLETPSPGLDSEEFMTYEAGVKGSSERWSVQAGYWYTDIDGSIVPSPTGRKIGGTPEVRKDNVGDGWAHGLELEGRLRVAPEWALDGAVSWMDGEVDQIDPKRGVVSEPLSRMMPLTASATLTFDPADEPWLVWFSGRAADNQDELSLKDRTDTQRIPDGGTPGYTVWSLGGRMRLSESAEVIVALDNLFDRNYRIHGSGVNEPGRNFVIALDLRF